MRYESYRSLTIFIELMKHPNYISALNYLMHKKGYIHLGWLNTGITISKQYKFIHYYSTNSGSSCIYVDKDYKVMYSVDR